MAKVECIVCGKAIKDPENAAMVLMATYGVLWTEKNAPADLPDSKNQGWFEIGPDCFRKVDRAGTAGFNY